MSVQQNKSRRDFIKGSSALVAGVTFAGSALTTLTANAATAEVKNFTSAQALNEEDFRNAVMPRAQLSIQASQLAVDKATNKNAKEFAGFELMEAIAVVKVLTDVGTEAPPMNADGKAFISKLRSASGNEFDKLYMEAELSNHEFLRDLAKNYLDNAEGKTSPAEKETQHIATIALFAFNEHVALCKRIYGEVQS